MDIFVPIFFMALIIWAFYYVQRNNQRNDLVIHRLLRLKEEKVWAASAMARLIEPEECLEKGMLFLTEKQLYFETYRSKKIKQIPFICLHNIEQEKKTNAKNSWRPLLKVTYTDSQKEKNIACWTVDNPRYWGGRFEEMKRTKRKREAVSALSAHTKN